jgi:hypothetical protein
MQDPHRTTEAKRSGVSLASAFRVGTLVLGAGAWLSLSSIVLLWIFPLNIVATGYVAYFAVRSLLHSFPRNELLSVAVLTLMLGALLSGYIWLAGDPVMRFIAGAYSVLNLAVFLTSAALSFRRLQGDA